MKIAILDPETGILTETLNKITDIYGLEESSRNDFLCAETK